MFRIYNAKHGEFLFLKSFKLIHYDLKFGFKITKKTSYIEGTILWKILKEMKNNS